MAKPREMTAEECREAFLLCVWAHVSCWERETHAPDPRAKLCGLAHSIMAMLDGGVGFLPGFEVSPSPHEDDREYNKTQGENWWPTAGRVDIAGELAYTFYRVAEKHGIDKGRHE